MAFISKNVFFYVIVHPYGNTAENASLSYHVMHDDVKLHRGGSAMTSCLEGNCFHSELISASESQKARALSLLNRSIPISVYEVSRIMPKLNGPYPYYQHPTHV